MNERDFLRNLNEMLAQSFWWPRFLDQSQGAKLGLDLTNRHMTRRFSESEFANADRITLWTVGAIVICLALLALLYFL